MRYFTMKNFGTREGGPRPLVSDSSVGLLPNGHKENPLSSCQFNNLQSVQYFCTKPLCISLARLLQSFFYSRRNGKKTTVTWMTMIIFSRDKYCPFGQWNDRMCSTHVDITTRIISHQISTTFLWNDFSSVFLFFPVFSVFWKKKTIRCTIDVLYIRRALVRTSMAAFLRTSFPASQSVYCRDHDYLWTSLRIGCNSEVYHESNSKPIQ